MGLFIFIFILLSALLFAIIIYINDGAFSLSGADFLARGREAGLNTKEIKVLKKTADVLNLEKPLLILGSIDNVNKAISAVDRMLEESNYRNSELAELLDDLYSYRRKIELQKAERRHSISSSREIEVGQIVKVSSGPAQNPYVGCVTDNNSECLKIDFSKDNNMVQGNYEGSINIYFWKKNDAGYYFESLLLEGSYNNKWKVAHSNNLIRNQKRQDVRVDVEFSGYIYHITDISKRNNKCEGFCGTLVQIENLSEGGAGLLIQGRVERGSPIKIEFKLLGKVVVICGIIKDANYMKNQNCSSVRVKFIEPHIEMISIVRSFIFNINKEQDRLKDDISSINVVNNEELNNNNNNDTDQDEIPEVEYLTEESEVLI